MSFQSRSKEDQEENEALYRNRRTLRNALNGTTAEAMERISRRHSIWRRLGRQPEITGENCPYGCDACQGEVPPGPATLVSSEFDRLKVKSHSMTQLSLKEELERKQRIASADFSSDDIIRYAGCTYRQLDYWVRTKVITPAVPAQGSGSQRRFSFDNLVHVARIVHMHEDIGVTSNPNLPHSLAD